jgi:hypothetical protein
VHPIRGSAIVLALVTFAAAHLAAPARALAGEGDAVRLTLSGPGLPYARVEMEARVRGASAVVRITRSFGDGFASQDAVGLSTPAELHMLMDELQADGLFAAPAPARPRGAQSGHVPDVKYVLEVRREGQTCRLDLDRPENLTDRRFVNAIERVRRFVSGVVEPGGARPFVDGRIPKDASGFLHLETSPPGRVYLDDVLLADATPIEALRLPLGSHALRIVARDGRLERRVEITIERGKTTSLRMNLE